MTHRHTFIVALAFGLALNVFGVAALGKESNRPIKRARPPKWTPDVLDAFFEDAREKLVGTRPDYSAARATASRPAPTSDSHKLIATSDATWSKLIDADVIETEIKRLSLPVSQAV